MVKTKPYTIYMGPYEAPDRVHVQNGVTGSYMVAVFKLVGDDKSEIWTSLSHSFTKGSLLQLLG